MKHSASKLFLTALFATITTGLSCTGLTQTNATSIASYPTKPIRLVVPFAPGGVTDTSGRIVAEGLSRRLNQQVIIENKPGASGNIGAQLVSTAAPDGYTLLLALDGTLVINPHAYEKVGFNALKDFAPIAKLGDSIIILVANPNQTFKTLKDMVTASKATPRACLLVPLVMAASRTSQANCSRKSPVQIWSILLTKGVDLPLQMSPPGIRLWP